MSYNGKNLFMTPRSRILVDIGTQVQCSAILHNMYLIKEKWFIRTNGALIIAKDPVEITLKPATKWSYKTLDNLDGGFYSKSQMQNLQKVVFAPLNQPAEMQNYINTINGNFDAAQDHLDPTRQFSFKDLQRLREKLQQSVWEHIKSTATSIGDFTSFIIGLYIIIRRIKFICNTIINAFIISYAFGFFNYRMIFACWSNIVSLFLHQENIVTRRPSPTPTNEDLPLVTIQPSVNPVISKDLYPNLPAYGIATATTPHSSV